MNDSFIVTVKFSPCGSEDILTKEMVVILTDEDSLEEIVQAEFCSFHKVIEYSSVPIESYVSDSFCYKRSARFIQRCLRRFRDMTEEISKYANPSPKNQYSNLILETTEDKQLFCEAISNPPQPNENLKKAKANYDNL